MARRHLLAVLTVVGGLSLAAALPTGPASASADRVHARESVVSGTMTSGGYPGVKPTPGGCVAGPYDANYSETALALEPGRERLVGGAKAYFGPWSTYKASHTASFSFGPEGPATHPVTGFDCVSTGTQAMPPSWTNTTDPNLEWDTRGRVHQVVLAYNAYWGDVPSPNGDVYGSWSDDGGRTWTTGNGGRALQTGPDPSTKSSAYLDKPWVTVQQDRRSPYRDHVYATWVQFPAASADPVLIRTAVSRDRGETWSAPVTVPQPVPTVGANPWPQIAAGADGAVHLSWVTYGRGEAATLWSARSTDDGRSWGTASRVADTTVVKSCCLPGTDVHDGAVDVLSASRTQPGHLYLTWEERAGDRLRVRLASSTDGGATWSAPVLVDDDGPAADQFSPTVASGPDGAVVVAFYDKRWRCPTFPAVLPRHRGKADTCIGVSVQAYRDRGAGPEAVGGNRRVTHLLWDPDQPGQWRQGLPQRACEDPKPDCHDVFIGDYIDLEVGAHDVYVLSTSTHYPGPGARADDGRKIYYQRVVLHTVSRRALRL